MPQSDGKNALKRMEIDFAGKTYKFNVNPEEYTQDEPSRSTVTQTKGGAWIDDFGAGLPTIFIKGSTGFGRGIGVDKFKELRNNIRKYYESGKLGSKPDKEIIFHNFTDDESWVVHTDPTGFKLLRNKNNPLLYMYEMKFICLRPAKQPAARARTGGVNRSIGTNRALTNNPSSSNLDVATANLTRQVGVVGRSIPSEMTRFVRDLDTLGVSIKNLDNEIRNPEITRTVTTKPSDSVFQVKPRYENQLSKLAIEELRKIKTNDNTIQYTNEESKIVREVIKHNLPANLRDRVKGVLLELVAISRNYEEEIFTSKINSVDVYRIINNINYICDELFKHSKKTRNLIEDLRIVQRVLYYLLDTELFEQTIQDKINTLRAN